MKNRMESFGSHNKNPYGHLESPEFKKGVETLETIDEIGWQSKIIILATALNLKPASLIEFRGHPEERKKIIEMFRDLGLFFSENEDKAEEYYEDDHLLTFRIGSTAANLAEAKMVHVSDNRHFGTSMGFPATSVEAYSRWQENKKENDLLMPQKEYHKVLTKEEDKFVFFRLSKEHYEEEIEWVEQIIAAVKQYAPRLYEEVISQPDHRNIV
jgi:hypothetical protein